MSNQDELDLFKQMMGDVKPIKQDTAELKKTHTVSDSQLAKRQAATWLSEQDPEYLSVDHAEMLKPEDIIEFKKDGVQEGVYRNLRLGRYQVDARLDLHRKSVVETRREIQGFIKECRRHGIRTVLVSHGRGRHEKALGNILKTYLATWLPNIDEVQAFHSAQPAHGGLGAIYVLLRKSEESRQANWEQHQKRGS